MRRVCAALAGAAVCALPLAGHAAVTAKDIQVAGRVLGFTANPPSGTLKFGIVYDPDIPGSARDEQDLLGILGTGLTIGNVTLVPVPIMISQIGTVPADLFFLTANMGADGAKVAAEATARKILCITTDLSETQAGNCALGVQTLPKVQITLNKAAAASSNVSFVSAFLLMITEI